MSFLLRLCFRVSISKCKKMKMEGEKEKIVCHAMQAIYHYHIFSLVEQNRENSCDNAMCSSLNEQHIKEENDLIYLFCFFSPFLFFTQIQIRMWCWVVKNPRSQECYIVSHIHPKSHSFLGKRKGIPTLPTWKNNIIVVEKQCCASTLRKCTLKYLYLPFGAVPLCTYSS